MSAYACRCRRAIMSAAVLGLVLCAAMGAAGDEPAKNNSESCTTLAELNQRLAQRIERIEFNRVPLDAAVAQLSKDYGIPVSADFARDWSRTPAEQPVIDVRVSDVTLKQLLLVMAACTGTQLEIIDDGGLPFGAYLYSSQIRNWKSATGQGVDAATIPQPANEKRQKATVALRERTDFQFNDTPLGDALDFIKDYHQVTVVYLGDPKFKDRPLTLEINGITLRDGLQKMLAPFDLVAVDGRGEIRIVPRADSERPWTLLYRAPKVGTDKLPLRDVVVRLRDAAGVEMKEEPASVELVGAWVVVTGSERQHQGVQQLLKKLRVHAKG